jgi:hypothetical protein
MEREIFKIKGRVALVFKNTKTGAVERIENNNLFVTTGRNKVRDYLAGDAPSYPTHCALSDDSDTVTAASSDVGVEILRGAITERIKTTEEVQINTYFNTSQAASEYIQKAGLVDASSGGTFFAIATFTRREKDPNETLTIEWVIEIGG